MTKWTLALATLLMLAVTTAASACPMCKDSVPNPESEAATNGSMGAPTSGLPGGFNTSVYMMLLSLFATLGFVSFMIVKNVRSTDARRRGFNVRSPAEQNPARNRNGDSAMNEKRKTGNAESLTEVK